MKMLRSCLTYMLFMNHWEEENAIFFSAAGFVVCFVYISGQYFFYNSSFNAQQLGVNPGYAYQSLIRIRSTSEGNYNWNIISTRQCIRSPHSFRNALHQNLMFVSRLFKTVIQLLKQRTCASRRSKNTVFLRPFSNFIWTTSPTELSIMVSSIS